MPQVVASMAVGAAWFIFGVLKPNVDGIKTLDAGIGGGSVTVGSGKRRPR